MSRRSAHGTKNRSNPKEFDLMGLLNVVTNDSANQIGSEQIAHINSLKIEIESLKNQLKERDEYIETLKRQKSKRSGNVDLTYIDAQITKLLTSGRLSHAQINALKHIQREKDAMKKIHGLVDFLSSISSSCEESAKRMCRNVSDLAVLLEQMTNENGASKLMISKSPTFKLEKEVLVFIEKVLDQTTEYLNSEMSPGIQNVMKNASVTPSRRRTDMQKLLTGGSLSTDEMKAMLMQEMAITDGLSKYARQCERRIGELENKPRQELSAMEDKIRAELSGANEDELKKLESDMEERFRKDRAPKIENELRKSLRPEVEERLKEEMRSEVMSQLKDDLEDSVRSELVNEMKGEMNKYASDDDDSDSVDSRIKRKLIAEIRPELEQSIRMEIEDSLRKQLVDEYQAQVDKIIENERRETDEWIENTLKPTLRKEFENNNTVRQEIEEQIKDSIMSGEDSDLRDSIICEIRPRIEREIRGDSQVISPVQIREIATVYGTLCTAARCQASDFTLDEFISLAELVAKEIIELRHALIDISNNDDLIQIIVNLKAQVVQLDQCTTKQRALLVQQAQRIAYLNEQTGTSSWLPWALKLYAALFDRECENVDDVSEIKLDIEEAVEKLLG